MQLVVPPRHRLRYVPACGSTQKTLLIVRTLLSRTFWTHYRVQTLLSRTGYPIIAYGDKNIVKSIALGFLDSPGRPSPPGRPVGAGPMGLIGPCPMGQEGLWAGSLGPGGQSGGFLAVLGTPHLVSKSAHPS